MDQQKEGIGKSYYDHTKRKGFAITSKASGTNHFLHDIHLMDVNTHKMAIKLKAKRTPINEIAELTDLSVEEIEAL